MLDKVAKRILITLAYSEQFIFPLNCKELYLRLIIDKKVSIADFIKSLQFLVDRELVDYNLGHFFVTGLSLNEQKSQVNSRIKKEKIAAKKWPETEQFISFVKKIPFITGVAVTGSLSVNNPVPDDDIDFMLVTKKHTLWITRLLIIFYSSLKGKRRSFAQEEKNSWCFNLWVEETDLQLPKISRSIYESFEVLQAFWIYSYHQVMNRFIKLNSWTKNFIYTKKLHISNENTLKYLITKDDSKLFLAKLFDYFTDFLPIKILISIINFLAFVFQFLYMKKRITREKVSYSHAFFHPRDTKTIVFTNWKKALQRLQ